jgi:kynureninase
VTPFESHRRGSQVTLRHPQANRIANRLADHGVIAEFRAPDLVRFGFAPLYISFRDLWCGAEILKRVLHEIEAPRRAHTYAGVETSLAQRSGP